jgi:hypothetical protein
MPQSNNFLQIERLTRVEEQVNSLKADVKEMNDKLDDLLILRWKGMGAFWLAATILGTGIVGILVKVFHIFGIPK